MEILSVEFFAIALFFISFYGLIICKKIIKSIICIIIMEMAVVLFLISIGFVQGMIPPIGTNLENAADPLLHALLVTTVIIGISVIAVNIVFFISVCRQYNATDWDTVKRNFSFVQEASINEEMK